MLSDEWLNDGEGLTRTRSADHPCTSEGIDDVHPSLAELRLVVLAHGDIHAILVLNQLLTLLEGLVLEVETVFKQPFLQELADVVEGNMDEYRSKDGGSHIKPDIESYRVEARVHTGLEEPDGNERHEKATDQGIEYLTTCIKLDMFLVPGANTGDTDTEDSGEFAPYEITIMIDKPPLHAVMDIADDASPVVKQLWVYGILEELNYQRDVDECSEYLIDGLKFFGFFHF